MARTIQTNATNYNRFWEIDFLRTVAIVMMITFHALYVPNYLGVAHTMNYAYHGFWWWFPRVTGGIFIFLAGVSLTITHSRSIKISRFLLRGLQIFAWGMGITLITWLIAPDEYVRFGILHFFGIAFMFAPFFSRFRFINLVMGIALLAIGIFLQEQRVFIASPWLFWLGLMPHGFQTMDYWPLLPWFGLFLVGMFCGNMLYPQGNRRFNIREFNDPITSTLTLPGRHPLLIYLAQWPVIVGILFILYTDKLIPYLPF